jgi:hypothetical protein
MKNLQSIESLEKKIRDFKILAKNESTDVYKLKVEALTLESDVDLFEQIRLVQKILSDFDSLKNRIVDPENNSGLKYEFEIDENDTNIINVKNYTDRLISFVITINDNEIIISKVVKGGNNISNEVFYDKLFYASIIPDDSYSVEWFRPGSWLIDLIISVQTFEANYMEYKKKVGDVDNNTVRIHELAVRSSFMPYEE